MKNVVVLHIEYTRIFIIKHMIDMVKKTIRLTEQELHNIVKGVVLEIIGNDVIYLDEGLIKSYDIDKCKTYLHNIYPNIKRIVSLEQNPYQHHKHPLPVKYNDFVGIVLDENNVNNYRDISETAYNLLGWSTGCVILRKYVKSGYIEYQFNNFNGQYLHTSKDNEEIDLDDFLSQNPKLVSFALILEAKFSEVYHQKPNEVFYHGTDKSKVQSILKQGLVPKSDGNFPDRIYLGKSVSEIVDMIGGNVNDLVILKVDVSNVKLYKLYRDQRNSSAVFTYDNIPPSQIEIDNELL